MSSLRKCPYFRGSLYTSLCSWEGVQYPHLVYTHLYVAGKVCSVLISGVVYTHLYVAGKVCSVLIKEVSLFQG